jgi:hypothetical protein
VDNDGYGSRPSEFLEGERVELHPGTDWWMRGARYGVVHKVGREWVHVRLDMTSAVIMLRPGRIRSATLV